VYFLNVGGGRDFNVPNTLNVPYIADERTLAKVYSAADIFLFPSLADNCPLVVLEAMACGLATIAYQTGGIPEIIENGKSGIITPYRNRAEFIKAVDRLISDSERRNALGTNARERVRQDFAVDLMVDKYVTLYQRLLSDSSARTRQTEIKTAVAIPNTVKQEQQYLVSAIVSTYNAGEFIRGCLEDLENQTIADKLEIIVVNSGSQQNEEAIVKEFQKKYDNIVYIKTEEREGLYKAWNRAVKAARGTFLTNANTDDRHRRDAFEIMSKELLASPDIALVYGDQICTDTPNGTFDSHHAVELAKRPEFSWQRLLFGCCVGSQPMWRKSLHDELGYFDETMDCASDWEFWLRTAQKYKFRRIPEFLGLYYRNEDGIEHGRKIHSLYERYIVGKKYGNPYISVIPIYTAKDNPLVSVIMPAFNASRYIAESIESVLIQSYRNFELIIVDDGSTDNTREVASRFKDDKINYFDQPNKGVSAARNLAIAKAKGTYIMPLDSDDMITPNSIAMHLEAFGKNPEVDLVYSDVLLINSESKPIKVNKKPEYLDRRFMIRDLVRAGHPVVPFRLGIRRCVFDKIGLYDESLIIGEDYDMMRRFVKEGLRVYHLNSPMHMRRITENSLTTDTRFAKMVAAKSKCHFNVIRRYTETFTYEEIFPDIQWVLIPPATRQLHFKCLVALNFISLGQNYIKKGLPVYARTSLVRAEKELDKCLEIDPDNGQVRQLLNKCQKIGANLSEPAILST
jgi:glycosyltransferase involved in cell wall biosynthesis